MGVIAVLFLIGFIYYVTRGVNKALSELNKPEEAPITYYKEAEITEGEIFLDFIYDLYDKTTSFEKVEDAEKYHTLYSYEKHIYTATIKTNLFHSHIEFKKRKKVIFSILHQKIDNEYTDLYIHPYFKQFSFQMNHAKDVLAKRSFDSAVETKTLEELHFLQRTLHKLAIFHLDNQFKQIEENYLFLESYKIHLTFDENYTIEETLIRDFKNILSAYDSLKVMNKVKALSILEDSIGLLVEKTNELKDGVAARCLTQLEKEKRVIAVR